MCDCEKKHNHHDHHGHHHDHHGHHHEHYLNRFLNGVPASVNLSEVSVIKGRALPGVPAAKLAKTLGFNSARRSGQQYAKRGYYT